MKEQQCLDCAHWEFIRTLIEGDKENQGYCTRYPPSVPCDIIAGDYSWPKTDWESNCGEFLFYGGEERPGPSWLKSAVASKKHKKRKKPKKPKQLDPDWEDHLQEMIKKSTGKRRVLQHDDMVLWCLEGLADDVYYLDIEHDDTGPKALGWVCFASFLAGGDVHTGSSYEGYNHFFSFCLMEIIRRLIEKKPDTYGRVAAKD